MNDERGGQIGVDVTDVIYVLLVEDDPDMRLMMRMTLAGDGGMQVTGEAKDAVTAVTAARAAPPDVIVLDHTIEGPTSGLEAAAELRLAAPGAKILLFSAHDLAAEAAAHPGVDAFLRKDAVRSLTQTIRDLAARS